MSWILKPKSKEHLSELLAKERGQRRVTSMDLSALSGIRRHTPEDLTATVAAGTSVKSLQKALARHQQWLPVDPPCEGELSVGELIAGNWSGPHRFGFGTIRDYLIGIKVILPDGSESNSGGQVVKNVAGFDLPRLFVGSHGSLGVIVEATFKLGPLPVANGGFGGRVDSGEAIAKMAQEILKCRLNPSILDAHSFEQRGNRVRHPSLIVGFSGSDEEVAAQSARLGEIGEFKPASTSYHDSFWQLRAPVQRHAVPPSEIGPTLDRSSKHRWVARVGNGVVYVAGESKEGVRTPSVLETRLKELFDPKGILPPIPQTEQGKGRVAARGAVS